VATSETSEAKAGIFIFTARREDVAEKLAVDTKYEPQGLKPALILGALRGAEAPLFHGITCIGEFFRNGWKKIAEQLTCFPSGAVPFPNPFMRILDDC
jgi:hypothetical protein